MTETATTTLERREVDMRIVDAAAVLAIVDAFVSKTVGRELISSGEAMDFGLDVRQALTPVEE